MYELLVQPFVEFAFMRRALFGAIFLSMIAAPLGIFLILRRLSLVSDAMTHAILPGVALGFFWAGNSMLAMLLGGLITGFVVALMAGFISRHTSLKEDASFAAFYLISLGLGVFLISVRGTNVDLMHVLFGSILSISDESLFTTMCVSSVSILILALIYRPLVLDCFDPVFLRVELGRRSWVFSVFIVLLVVNLVAGFQILGTLMVVGVVILPAITARFLGRTLGFQLIIAPLVGVFCQYVGLVISYAYDLPTSASIILINGIVTVLAMLFGPYGSVRKRYQA
ncbi:metal ABC transporter permease [Oligella urethralis]|uniref:metal ABC transporter permease n=1 Tax=Oligella urethralis TaxID=90245 RepID=UPI000CFE92C3|nr:metal ABC transporter permease [Oligella urethralis]AVL70228.1 iron ABC transporter [Oligella urethralis]MDK6202949.1 metal ABC transporter permease [Oligella urethralis]